MSTKKFINSLSEKNSNYNNPEQAITTANLCDTISRDINTDSQRFVYELLQNADDASNQSGYLDVYIEFIDEYVVVAHKGEPFTEVDIESISSAGDGTKSGDSNKTGFKGIGFKSVFHHSNLVVIKSGDYCFKYDKLYWKDHWNDGWGSQYMWKKERRDKNKDDYLKMPWQIIPIWTEVPNKIKNNPILDTYQVITIIKFDKNEELQKSLNDLFSESQIVLFLRSKHVKITFNGNQKLILEKSTSDEVTYLKRNGEVLSEWLFETKQFPIPVNVQSEINADDKSPKKLKDATQAEMSFAIKLDKGKLIPIAKANRLIFTYLPTSINYNLPFLVNASFLTDAGRQHLHYDSFWNKWLFAQMPVLYFEWISKLSSKDSKYNRQFLDVVPHKLDGLNALEEKFNEGYTEAIKRIAFIPNIDGDLLKVSESIFDETNISDFINKEMVLNFINKESNDNFSISSFIPNLKPTSTLKRLGVKMFGVDKLESFFTSDIFVNEHSLEDNFNLISFLYKQSNYHDRNENNNEWNFF